MISTVIITYNEGGILKNCLDSVVKESGEIVVIDLGSTDDTVKIAKQYNARIFTHTKVDYVEKVRNLSIAKASGDWVLILDSDERMSPNLWKTLKDVIMAENFVAVNIPRKNIFFGKWISHTNWWPDRHVRFFKKGTVSWSNKIHVYPKVEGNVLDLPVKEELAIIHFGYTTIAQLIDRQNRYSTMEAQNLYDLGKRFSWKLFFWKPSREFLVRFIKHAGFLDGFYGFALTFLMMVYQLEVMIKLWEKQRK